MKLFTHNCLTSAMLKGVKVGFPLKIEATKVEEVSSDFNKNFILKMLSRIDYAALFTAASQLQKSDGLPKSRDEVSDAENNEELLRKLHHVLFELEVIEGDLICPETGRRFPIANGIPNMLVNEDEANPGRSNRGQQAGFVCELDSFSEMDLDIRARTSANLNLLADF